MNLYGFFIFLGLFISILSFLLFKKIILKKNFNLNSEKKNKILDFFLTIYFFSFIGGKLFFLAFHHFEILSLEDFFVSGFSILGASFFGFSYYLYICKKDFFLGNFFSGFPLFINLIHAFGRIGCFYANCCGGNFLDFKIQIISSIWYLLNFIFSLFFIIKTKDKNKIFIFSSIFYIFSISFERIIFDFFRDDKIIIFYNFSLYQAIGIAFFLYFLFLNIFLFRKK